MEGESTSRITVLWCLDSLFKDRKYRQSSLKACMIAVPHLWHELLLLKECFDGKETNAVWECTNVENKCFCSWMESPLLLRNCMWKGGLEVWGGFILLLSWCFRFQVSWLSSGELQRKRWKVLEQNALCIQLKCSLIFTSRDQTARTFWFYLEKHCRFSLSGEIAVPTKNV